MLFQITLTCMILSAYVIMVAKTRAFNEDGTPIFEAYKLFVSVVGVCSLFATPWLLIACVWYYI